MGSEQTSERLYERISMCVSILGDVAEELHKISLVLKKEASE